MKYKKNSKKKKKKKEKKSLNATTAPAAEASVRQSEANPSVCHSVQCEWGIMGMRWKIVAVP